MNNLDPSSQCKLFGLNNYLLELIKFYKANSFPNKILLSGQKGIGKSTLAYHFFNYVLSENENYKYDICDYKLIEEYADKRPEQISPETYLILFNKIYF